MASKTNKTGTLIKEARTAAKLTQEQLASQINNVTASDISKAERGEKMLTQTALKEIAKVCGVTQSSLLNAYKEDTEAAEKNSKTSSSKTSSSKTSSKTSSSKASSSKTSSKTTSSKTSSSKTSSKTSSKSSSNEYELTSKEKTLINLYRKADKDLQANCIAVLKGEKKVAEDLIGSVLNAGLNLASGLFSNGAKTDEDNKK